MTSEGQVDIKNPEIGDMAKRVCEIHGESWHIFTEDRIWQCMHKDHEEGDTGPYPVDPSPSRSLRRHLQDLF